VSLYLNYNLALFESQSIARLADNYEMLLAEVVASLKDKTQPEKGVEELTLLSDKERQQILVDWNDTASPYPQDQCIHELFEAQVRQTPNSTAVVFEEQTLSY
ncbi:hypothetical protein, partial [Pseudoalteromonas holothuriae]|uniref:hypothetical protein n=1 Tax=Pseudoalteromonas holothuriae TaxID=2963714 RepID=UPI0021BF9FAC